MQTQIIVLSRYNFPDAINRNYGQQRSRDCESTLDRVTNWLYLFLVPLASFNLLQYYTRLGGGGLRDSRIVSGPMEGGEGWVPRQSHNLRTNGRRGGGLRDSRIVSGLKRFSLGLFGSHVF